MILRVKVSTGGNAGMAAAYSARQLGVPATIVVPSVTPNQTVERLKDEGANVIIHGKVCHHNSNQISNVKFLGCVSNR